MGNLSAIYGNLWELMGIDEGMNGGKLGMIKGVWVWILVGFDVLLDV